MHSVIFTERSEFLAVTDTSQAADLWRVMCRTKGCILKVWHELLRTGLSYHLQCHSAFVFHSVQRKG